jgi:hypothetical protein
LKQTILALCHELHCVKTYRVSSHIWALGNHWVNVGHKSGQHPCGWAKSKLLMSLVMCIEHVYVEKSPSARNIV